MRQRFVTIPQMFVQVTDYYSARNTSPQRGDARKYVYMRKVGKEYVGMTYDELRELTENFAAGLKMLGIQRGDRVGIVSENRIEWVIADFAIIGMGAIDVPIFPTMTSAQESYIFNHCEAKAVIVSNKFQLNKLVKVRSEIPSMQHIIVMNDDVETDEPNVLKFAEVVRFGAASMSADDRCTWFAQECAASQPDDLVTLIYTSGTTGNPKGVMLTNTNIVSNIEGSADAIDISEKDLLLSFLPLCHAYERTTGYYTLFACHATVAFAVSIDTVAENMKEVRPTYMTAVPRLFERIQGRILSAIEKDTPTKQRIFHWAIGIGRQYIRQKLAGKRPSPLLAAQYAVADRLVFAKIRERTGGRLRAFISGGAALPKDLAEFFFAAGITILEGYGLTEASPVLSVTRASAPAIGTVGKPLFNVQIKIAEDGEILAKGPNIMRGYLHDEAATKAVIDEEGWLHTGDIGMINEDGNLVITDRKKNIFVSSGGKNIAPQPIENTLTQSRFIDQVVLIGEKREYCTALIVPDFDYVKEYAASHGLSYTDTRSLLESDALLRAIQQDIDELQAHFAKYEKVRKFRLLDKAFTVEDGEITPKLNVRRHVIEKKYADIIEAMYAEP
ncbi:MAG: long-chain fatty acid--CoA ligase [Bacteroidota bacterium]|nr:long-chain fatty acid--CoA ligase [Candidatus Kapabacteria bacterium]MDW8220219.1 long-chain fatty acid--CoA ligase [Bacteroidota bacterium]